tara:strand:+ start:493 stop:870 length:378 start_codon:yes stop_codon:yes gene_type:complete
MVSYVYLVQNGDLFNIGFTNNLERTRIDLRPGELLAFSITENPEALINNLRKIYIDSRLPGSDYYRLANSQVNECRTLLESDGSTNYFQPFLKGPKLIIFFILSWFFITYIIIEFAINPILIRFS